MSSGDVTGLVTTQNGRKQIPKQHARVAIPLPLSKPRNNAQTKAGNKQKEVKEQEIKLIKEEIIQVGAQDNTVVEEKVQQRDREAIVDKASTPDDVEKSSHNAIAELSTLSNDTPKTTDTEGQSTATIESKNFTDLPNASKTSPTNLTQIRTQLPPAFVPLSDTPSATDSASHSERGSQLFTSNGSRPHNNAEKSSTPVDNNPPHRQYSRHSPHAPPFIPPTHSHSPSVAGSFPNDLQTSPFTPGNQAPFQTHNRNGSYSNPNSYGRQQFHSANNSLDFSQRQPRNTLHGFGSFDNATTFIPSSGYDTPPVLPSMLPSVVQMNQDAINLRQHVRYFFTSDDFSDVRLECHQDGTIDVLHGHKIVLVRSPVLSKIIQKSGQTATLMLHGKWATIRAYKEVILWLYGGDVLGLDGPNTIYGETVTAKVQHALAYITVAQLLELPMLVQRGIEIVSSLLRWENLSTALSYCLEGASGSVANGQNGDHAMNGNGVNETAASQLLHSLMQFMVFSLPANFYIDTTATQLKELARLPEMESTESNLSHRSTRSVNDPRLSRIRFGEISVGSSPFTTISSILVSLPLRLLASLLEHPALSDRLGPDSVASVTRQVIMVRESRRAQALKQTSQISDSSSAILFQEEIAVDDYHSPSGLRLTSRQLDRS